MSNNLNQPVKKGKTPPVPKPKGATGNEPASFSPKSTQAPGAKVAIEVPGTAKIAVADLPGQLEEAATAAPVQQPPAQQGFGSDANDARGGGNGGFGTPAPVPGQGQGGAVGSV